MIPITTWIISFSLIILGISLFIAWYKNGRDIRSFLFLSSVLIFGGITAVILRNVSTDLILISKIRSGFYIAISLGVIWFFIEEGIFRKVKL